MSSDTGPGAHERGDIDATFDALADETRRLLLYFLREHETATLDTLADVLTGWRAVRDDREPTTEHRDRLYARLYHVHVPRLADSSMVTFDADAERVRLAPLSEPLARLLDEAFDLEPGVTEEWLATADGEP
ncbi:DUF7344 domain-containing protein [Halorarius halobius]|uniref:DUF7344 domain-containing protein n=1 Tax=Halorarius halobius TaxID=2962671 RepID=UPI0020CCEC26|nr:hypothetical protein [Halorarius halobius]